MCKVRVRPIPLQKPQRKLGFFAFIRILNFDRDWILTMETSKELSIEIRQVLPTAAHVEELIAKLDQYQISLYGIEACNLESSNSLIKSNAYMLGAFVNGVLCGIGAIKFVADYAEVKRMYVDVEYRGLAVAEKILAALESYAISKGTKALFFETGKLHHAAIKFYVKNGFEQVSSFGRYKANHVSVYFCKSLAS